MDQIEQLKTLIEQSEYIVFFGGAGVSTESGIPDYRSENGRFNALRQYGEEPETLLSHSYFIRHPEKFYDYYWNNIPMTGVEPNAAHYALAKLEAQGKLKAVITQNIDGLHTKAGSKKVLELHGSGQRNYCMKCGRFYETGPLASKGGVPYCECGGLIRPDVVLYEEGLDSEIMEEAQDHVRRADCMIVGGTSLVVYPAAGLVGQYSGDNLVLINKSTTMYDDYAHLIIHRPIGEVLGAAVGI